MIDKQECLSDMDVKGMSPKDWEVDARMGISQKDVTQEALAIMELDRMTKLRAASAALSFV